jgi:hypothetical protein
MSAGARVMSEAETRVRDSFARQGFMRKLGVEFDLVGPGVCGPAAAFDESMTQQHGHAGVTATIADSAAGYAACSPMPENSTVLTAEFKLSSGPRLEGQDCWRGLKSSNRPLRLLSCRRMSIRAQQACDAPTVDRK